MKMSEETIWEQFSEALSRQLSSDVNREEQSIGVKRFLQEISGMTDEQIEELQENKK